MIHDHHWHILAAAAIAAVLWRGIQATAGLPGPPDPDHYRDIAQAQATADGDPFADAFYKNEHVWYNPLVPWIIGGVSRASATPPVRVHLTLGPWLNVAGPAGIYVLGSTLLGPPAGISALFVYVFCRCNDLPSWTCATYSPWLFPSNFAQGLFFLALAALLVGERRRDIRTIVLTAVLSGLVLLAHTAPALILSAVAAALLIRTPARLATFGAITALVASPFLFWIVAHYHLYVRNAAPMEWTSALPWPDAAMLLSPATLLGMALAAIGVLALWSEGSSRLAMAVWFAVCAGFMAYRVIRDSAHWYSLPAVVPAFHFFTYLSALLALLIGAGVWFVAGRLPPPGAEGGSSRSGSRWRLRFSRSRCPVMASPRIT